MKRVGILTSGGDCQALNATMRGVGKGLYNELGSDVEIYGFEEGYKGLIYNEYRLLTARDFSGILTRGGTILGSSRQSFKNMRIPDENGLDKVAAMKQNYRRMEHRRQPIFCVKRDSISSISPRPSIMISGVPT